MKYYCIEIENYWVIFLSNLPMEEEGGDNVGFRSVKIYMSTIENFADLYFQTREFIQQLEEKFGNFYLVVMTQRVQLRKEMK